MRFKLKKLHANANIPKRQTAGSAGYDLCACLSEEQAILPGHRAVIPTGLAAEIPADFAGMIFTRSGLGVKYGVHVSNGVGVIDSDYRGEIQVALTNSGTTVYTVYPGDRIAQLLVMPVATLCIEVTDSLDETLRGTGGFGSTGFRTEA